MRDRKVKPQKTGHLTTPKVHRLDERACRWKDAAGMTGAKPGSAPQAMGPRRWTKPKLKKQHPCIP